MLPAGVDVFEKPFDTARLIETVEKIFERQANAR
jgi:FixJ family two-component response regulator